MPARRRRSRHCGSSPAPRKQPSTRPSSSLTPVRSQRKQVFQKTGASRQSELVRLVFRLMIVLPESKPATNLTKVAMKISLPRHPC